MATAVPASQTSPEATLSRRIRLFHALSVAARVASIAFVVVALLSVISWLLPGVEKATSIGPLAWLWDAQDAVARIAHRNVTPRTGGARAVPIVVIAGALLLGGGLRMLSERLRDRAESLRLKASYEEWKSQMHLAGSAPLLAPMNQKLERFEASGKAVGKADREELLSMFAEIKKKLDQMGKDLAFLSVDVVDSTGMKMGEEQAAVEYDFKMYKQLVDGALAECGCLKATWTPDGVMGCFSTVDAAVRAARQIVLGLDDFNRNVKTMKRDFAVRCGVNSGYVYFDEALPLEEISDRVIDVAAHIQKSAAPNTIGVAQPAIEPLRERHGFLPSGKVVDGYQIYEWKQGVE